MNRLKTTFLLATLTGLFLFFGHLAGGTQGMIVAFGLAAAMNFFAYFFSDKLVLALYRARPAPEGRLVRAVRILSTKTGMPMPKVYIVPSPTPNAFATGRNPRHAAVAATEGLLELLDDEEIEAVVAHELGHIQNRDILVSSIVATIAGAISMIAGIVRWTAILGGSRDHRSGNLLGMLAMAFLAPLVALILQLAISRSREYHADETGARTTGHPLALASALGKIHGAIRIRPMPPTPGREATAHLFIENPFSARGLVALFSTHPPVEKRIERLVAMSR